MSLLLRGLVAAVTLACYGSVAHAQTVSDGYLSYEVGAIRFVETPRAIMMFKGDRLLGSSFIRAGGWLSPAISMSDDGRILWGEKAFDSVSGAQVPPPMAARCMAKVAQQPGVLTAIQGNRLIVASPVSDADDRTVAYTTEIREFPKCKATERQQIARTDIDHFFELGASQSGLWLLGSGSDGTLLVRQWSNKWTRVAPPTDVNGILSAHWSSDGRLWVLADELTGDRLTAALFVTDDLGKTWMRQPYGRANLPCNWLEAIRQLSAYDFSK